MASAVRSPTTTLCVSPRSGTRCREDRGDPSDRLLRDSGSSNSEPRSSAWQALRRLVNIATRWTALETELNLLNLCLSWVHLSLSERSPLPHMDMTTCTV